MDLVPIKVKIGTKTNGHANYPDFNQISSSIRKGMDWSKYVDVEGIGWHYDKVCGHSDDETSSPRGTQWGVLVVPKDFADSAIATFPDEVSKIDETTLETFYDERSHAHEADNFVDEKALKEYETKATLGVTLTAKEETTKAKALDPNDITPGIRKNDRKKWADLKAKQGINIVQ